MAPASAAIDDPAVEPAPIVHAQTPEPLANPIEEEVQSGDPGNQGLVDVFQQALREAEKRGRSSLQLDSIPVPAKGTGHEPDDEPEFGEGEPSYDDADFARSAEAFEGIADGLDGDDVSLEDASPAPRQSRPKPPPPKRQARPEGPERPRLTMDEAIQRIDPEARQVLTEVLKGQFKEIRSYRKR